MERSLTGCRANITLERTSAQTWCAHTGSVITEGTPAVVIRSATNEQHAVVISVGAIEGLIDHLEAVHSGAARVNASIANGSRIKYGRISSGKTCPVCHNTVAANTVELSLYQPEDELQQGRGIARPSPIRCHQSCIPTIIEGLENVWEYTDEIIGHVA